MTTLQDSLLWSSCRERRILGQHLVFPKQRLLYPLPPCKNVSWRPGFKGAQDPAIIRYHWYHLKSNEPGPMSTNELHGLVAMHQCIKSEHAWTPDLPACSSFKGLESLLGPFLHCQFPPFQLVGGPASTCWPLSNLLVGPNTLSARKLTLRSAKKATISSPAVGSGSRVRPGHTASWESLTRRDANHHRSVPMWTSKGRLSRTAGPQRFHRFDVGQFVGQPLPVHVAARCQSN